MVGKDFNKEKQMHPYRSTCMPINGRHNGDVTLSQMSCLAAQIRAASGSFGYVFINGGEPINETSLLFVQCKSKER